MGLVLIRSRQLILLGTASTLVLGVASLDAAAQSNGTAAAPGQPAQAASPSPASPGTASNTTENITVRAAKRLLKEQNSPSAVTELGQQQINSVGVSGSVGSLLRQAPSVNVYQQGIGDNAPVLTIRGQRGLGVASTLDGVPTQDLLNGGTGSNNGGDPALANNVGSYFNLDQISDVSVYPGVAYPNKNTFGTIGGTIAYATKRPSNEFGIDLTGEVGSFDTYKEGIAINTGAIDGPLGSGDNAPKVLLQYSNLQTGGFIDYTPARYNNFQFALDKPYDNGASKFQATVLYNSAKGLLENEAVPIPYLDKYGLYSNYPTSASADTESNDFLTVILKDDTYVNDWISAGITGFYLQNDNETTNYAGIDDLAPAGVNTPVTVGGSTPFINNPAGFGLGGLYGPGTPNYLPGIYTYNPLAAYPPGSKYCPTKIVAEFTAAGLTAPCGINSMLSVGHDYTYGVQPRVTFLPPDIYGIANTIQIGGIVAKETAPSTKLYFGGGPTVQQTPGNLAPLYPVGPFGGADGGVQRTIMQAYAQDKIDLFANTLHITPGVTLEGTYSSFGQGYILNPVTTSYESYKATKWNRETLPFLNISYDLDGIAPALKGASLYASTGQSALFAPVTDFGPNTNGSPPNASIVHMYEFGVKYNTSRLLLTGDYFYQKVDRDFGYFTAQSGPDAGFTFYNDNGQSEFKGFEGSVVWLLRPDLQLFGNASKTLAHYLQNNFGFVTVSEDQYGIALKGAPIAGVPDWLSTFGVDWSPKNLLRSGDRFDVRISEAYTGHQATTYDISGNASVPDFDGLSPNVGVAAPGTNAALGQCQSSKPSSACVRFSQLSGATVYDPNGGNNPYWVTNLDLNYTLPTPFLPLLKQLNFDLNFQNLLNAHYFQYLFKQVSPSDCKATASDPTRSQYNCTPSFSDGIPGQPFSVFFTVKAHF